MAEPPVVATPVVARRAVPGPVRGPADAPPITRGAELVLLAEAVQIRLFRVLAGFVLAGCAVAVGFAIAGDGDSDLVTCAAAAGGAVLGTAALVRPQPAYLLLRRSVAARVGIVAFSCVAVLLDGVDGPAWWVSLGLAMLLATLGSARETFAGALAVAVAFAAGALLADGSLARHGTDAGVLAGASGIPLYALVVRVVADGFARVLLMVHRARLVAERGLAAPVPPVRPGAPRPRPPGGARVAEGPAIADVPGTDLTPAAPVGVDGVPATPPPARRPVSSRLTVRQLEVALLARDGLLQAEIAEALAISVTQVERHLRQGRERVGAATVGELLAVLVTDGVIGAPEGAVDDRGPASAEQTRVGAPG